jgi:hypothetical protein
VTVLRAKSAIRLVVLETGGKTNHLGLMTHRGGGWWQIECMGEGKRCKAGECAHTARVGVKTKNGTRPVRQVPRRSPAPERERQ